MQELCQQILGWLWESDPPSSEAMQHGSICPSCKEILEEFPELKRLQAQLKSLEQPLESDVFFETQRDTIAAFLEAELDFEDEAAFREALSVLPLPEPDELLFRRQLARIERKLRFSAANVFRSNGLRYGVATAASLCLIFGLQRGADRQAEGDWALTQRDFIEAMSQDPVLDPEPDLEELNDWELRQLARRLESNLRSQEAGSPDLEDLSEPELEALMRRLSS